MPPRVKHRVLGCKFNGSAKSWISTYENSFQGIGNYPERMCPQGVRTDDINSCLGIMALQHLGYKLHVDTEDLLNRGFDVVVDYFCGDWWKSDEEAIRALDKSQKRKELTWFGPFSNGLLLGLLSQRWDELARVCSWLETKIKADYLDEKMEEELPYLYYSIGASLRSEPMPGLDKLEKEIINSRSKRPKLLFEAWNAARCGNQEEFNLHFRKSVKQFASNFKSGMIPIEWIAQHQSVVAMAAQLQGMCIPALPLELNAFVMTRESIGL